MQSMEELYNEYFNTVYKYLVYLTHGSNFSEELTQETFCKALEKLHTFKGECKVSVWLCQIAKNLLINEQKKKKRILNKTEEELVQVEDEKNLEEAVILKDDKINLYKRMQKLDGDSKEVVHLRTTGELSFKEIGEILGKTETWARVTFYRAKKKLMEVDENGKIGL